MVKAASGLILWAVAAAGPHKLEPAPLASTDETEVDQSEAETQNEPIELEAEAFVQRPSSPPEQT